MTYTRYKPDDWVVEVSGYGRDNVSLNQSIIAHDKLWISGSHQSTPESGVRYMYGLSLRDGSVQTTIDVTGLGGNQYGNGDKNVDQNGYIWLDGPRGFSTTSKANQAIDVINNTLITRVGNQTTLNYGDWIRVFDPNNNVIWAYRNTTTLQAISTVSYTESYSISDRADGGFTVDYDKNEVWVCNNSANTIKRYNATTGVLNGTVTSSHTMFSRQVRYIPEKKYVLVSDSTTIQLWSTLDYTLVGTISATGNESVFPRRYHAPTDTLLVVHENYDTGFYTLRSYSLTSPFDYTTFELNLLPNDDPFGNDQLVHGAIEVDDKGSIYLGVSKYESGNYTTYVYKIAYEISGCYQPTDPSLYTGQSDVFNREIVFDLDLGAFFVNDFGYTDSAVRINDYVSLPMYTQSNPDTNVLVGSEHVIITSGEEVVVPGYEAVSRVYNPRGERFKYLATSATGVSLVEYRDFSFRDYVSIDGGGFPFASYLLTGYDLSGDMMKKKRSIYLIVYCERTEKTYTLTEDGVVLSVQSGCIVQSQWEWANSAATGRWGRPFQAYRLLRPQPSNPQAGDTFDYGERVIVTKNKLRGSGRSLSLFIQAECSKDLKLLGWGLDMTRQDFV